jgi:hypothetical protein
MSFAQGQILTATMHYGTVEMCQVLSEGKVMIFSVDGKPHREVMLLADWQLMQQAPQEAAAPAAAVEPAAPAAEPAAPAPEPEPVLSPGSFIRWKLDENNRYVAIALRDQAILVVKGVKDGQWLRYYNYRDAEERGSARKHFATLAEWKATLPAGGTFEIEARDTTSSIERHKKDLVWKGSDVEYVTDALNVWGVKQYVCVSPSLMQRKEETSSALEQKKQAMMAITYGEVDGVPHYKRLAKVTNAIGRLAAELARKEWEISKVPVEHANRPGWIDVNVSGTSRLYAFKDGRKCHLAVKDGSIYVTDYGRSRWARTFAELGVDMVNGKPRLEVLYRKEVVAL